MTFDFAPGWLGKVTPCTENASPAAQPPAPQHPTMGQVAELVKELFTEGTLSFEQLCSLSNVPEMETLLEDKVAAVPPARRNRRA